MAGALDINTVSLPLGDPGGDNKKIWALRAPNDAYGGGISILGGYVVNGAATGVGTSFSLALHKYSSAGTPAVNGTVAAAVGGTATPWADGEPQSFTIDSDYQFLDAGEWLVAQYNEQTSGNPTNATLVIHYVMGR